MRRAMLEALEKKYEADIASADATNTKMNARMEDSKAKWNDEELYYI